MILNNFSWYCKKNDFPEIQRITSFHISHFLRYLAAESNRWDSTSPAARRPANKTTVNCYYRSLRTFFNWLKREEFIPDNPCDHIKTPKTENKVIQAFTPDGIDRLFKLCSGRNSLDTRNKAIPLKI